MDVRFEKEYLRELYEVGTTSDKKHRYQPQVAKNYAKCVKILVDATRIEDLFGFNSLGYEKLLGNKKGLSSLRINRQYRLEFREIPSQTDNTLIEVCSLVDITNHYQ
jgi:proteic killer suppression protein